MKKINILLLIPFVGFLISCEDVAFQSVLPTANEVAAVNEDTLISFKDPNFNDEGEFIDNKDDGLEIGIISSPIIDPNLIGNPGETVKTPETCIKAQGATTCYNNETSEVIVGDSFERADIAPANNNIFSWRTIINDNGKIIDGTSSNNVELKSYDSSILGEASNGDRSLYFTGREGFSIHNLYLVTKAFDLSQTNGIVYFSFDYLPIGLDNGEYLRLEVCNDDLNSCGVGNNISVAGLNSDNWKTVFESTGNEVRGGLNGFNHTRSDWVNKQLAIRLDGFQRDNFVFRINVRVDEGFLGNNILKGVDDAVGIDNFKAFSFVTK